MKLPVLPVACPAWSSRCPPRSTSPSMRWPGWSLRVAQLARGIQTATPKKLPMPPVALNTSTVIEDMDIPGFGLNDFKGQDKGRWPISVNGNWRPTPSRRVPSGALPGTWPHLHPPTGWPCKTTPTCGRKGNNWTFQGCIASRGCRFDLRVARSLRSGWPGRRRRRTGDCAGLL